MTFLKTELHPDAPVNETNGWSCVLFDLDGTLMDSAPGITGSLVRVLTNAGLDVPAAETLNSFVGPPLLDSLMSGCGLTESAARDLLVDYRQDYSDHGAFDSAVFPGIRGVLGDLASAGIPLAVATSKPQIQALRILKHFELDQYFRVIAGANEDESRSKKSDIVQDALTELRERGLDISQPVMVGDRSFDVVGAAAHSVPTILVEWGYGSPQEALGSIAVVHSTDQLRSLLLG